MKNAVFISPNFPTNYWQFCAALKRNGLNVLGIGDQPYDAMAPEVRASLTEYYWVDSLENNDAVYRAVAYFIHKYGRVSWLESNNEYWLERDAWLRTQFHITSGFQEEDIDRIKYKSKMKAYYAKAGIPACRWHMVDDFASCMKFIREVGWPVVVKPDNGVGASDTHKLESEADLRAFLKSRRTWVPYIMEEFVHAEVNSYDAIIDSKGEPMFETGNVTPMSIMDIVNQQDNSLYYIVKTLAPDVRKAGRAAVKAWGVKSRFVHFEFFRLNRDQAGLGKQGDVVALEVNMRPCGGFTPDMINFAHSTNVYQIWADMVAFDHSETPEGEHAFCAFAGRRDGKDFALTDEGLMAKYYKEMRLVGRIPDALADAMGNQMFVACFPTQAKLDAFYHDAVRENAPRSAKAPAHPAPKGKAPAAKPKATPKSKPKTAAKPKTAPKAKAAPKTKASPAKPAKPGK